MRICLECDTAFGGVSWRCPSCSWAPPETDGVPLFAPSDTGEGAGFSEDFFPELARLEEGHFWFEARNEIVAWAIERFHPGMRSFMEVGCGTGFVLSFLSARYPAARMVGSEYFAGGLRWARPRVPRAELLQMDVRRVPFADEFDAVGAFDVLEHVEEDTMALAGLYRSLRPGGTLFVTVPQHRFLWTRIDDFSFHKRRYTRSELVRKTEGAGFEVLHVTSFVSLLLPALLISRIRSTDPNRAFDPRAELRISPALNKAMRSMMRVEFGLLRMCSLPMGGSLLLVARKPRR